MSLVVLKVHSNKSAEIELSRPEKLNALSGAMIADFAKVLLELEHHVTSGVVNAVLVRSAAAPKAFCAGADLGERIHMNDEQVSQTLRNQRAVMDGIAAIAVPVVAAIEGVAFGGGLELALACDLRVASPNSQMGLTETKLAIIPGAGGTQRLRLILGEAKAKELIFTGMRLLAPEALQLGLLNAVDSHPLTHAQNWISEMLACGPLALRAAKKAIEAHRSNHFASQLDAERTCYESVLKSEDRLEGLKAFVEKRIPKYSGK